MYTVISLTNYNYLYVNIYVNPMANIPYSLYNYIVKTYYKFNRIILQTNKYVIDSR